MDISRNRAFLRAIVLATAWASVCPSVTLLYCVKTVQAWITKSLLWAAPKTLVYQ